MSWLFLPQEIFNLPFSNSAIIIIIIVLLIFYFSLCTCMKKQCVVPENIHTPQQREFHVSSVSSPGNFYFLNKKLTTALQSGGWLPETSRSFHYWQPAPRWRPLPWLANPGNPAMSPHKEGEKTGTRHTDKTVERKGGTGEGRQPPRSPHTQKTLTLRKTLTKTTTKPLQCPMDQEHEES